ncbi:ATP-binding protein [Paenibacillus baekrokdamisoli]|uniref:ATP-binding protein n=1 Tax=Paenibacillus baekrokdamisoli TaxID=1712516 RepID=A0A3G9J6M0_9BACL|nr:MoxR family ATPase [Paenibacillus baekrokdamisoli]MBB3070420.1 MoxR-like ATPase [Paenibacillus baekrokdamisoli]BBH21421.1 ATP-binding protein [Paenibacillus baekrokdamisoli]
MNIGISVSQKELKDILLNVAVVRPIFIWGPPGIGKSSLVEQFADELGLACVSLLGSQLAPEDIIGVPQIKDGVSEFCPPKMIARNEPYCLFLDELNACSQEVQKAFYSLIHERRIGEYRLPQGSIVIGAGNRAQDSAIVKPMSSALINRMFHVQLKVQAKEWFDWAYSSGIHPYVIEYLQARPDHLWTQPPKTEEPFSTPRSWHMLSDALNEFKEELSSEKVEILARGCLTPDHALQFKAFHKNLNGKYQLNKIINGDARFPSEASNRDLLYFLSLSFRAQIIKTLPENKESIKEEHRSFAHRVKALLKELSEISLEMAQLVVADHGEGQTLPNWFTVEIVRDLPRLAAKDK